MRLGLILLLLIGSMKLSAGTAFDLKLDMIFYGKALPTSRFKVKEGEKITITNTTDISRNFVELVAYKSPYVERPGILIKFNIGTMNDSGVKTLVSSPQVITKENQMGQITQGDKRELSISVTASSLQE